MREVMYWYQKNPEVGFRGTWEVVAAHFVSGILARQTGNPSLVYSRTCAQQLLYALEGVMRSMSIRG